MGEKAEQLRIYLADTGEAVGIADGVTIHMSAEQPEQEDATDWSHPPSFTITGSALISPEDHERMMRRLFFTRKEVKHMFYDITHGYYILFLLTATDENGDEREMLVKVNCPSELRRLLSMIRHARCDYSALPKMR